MKAQVLDINGKKKSEITLPSFFSETVRADLIQKIIEAKKVKQPYGPSAVAGNNYSASGVLKHHRKVWKSQYGRGMSRIPRKQMSRRGSQFNWVGATVPNTRGGRRAHPPKAFSMVNTKNLNKKELKLGLISAISATAIAEWIKKRYAKLVDKEIKNFPIIVEEKITKLNTKGFDNSLKKILGEEVYTVVEKKKSIRSGRGKRRGRKYSTNLGLILVKGNGEKVKIKSVDVKAAKNLSVVDLAKGGPGRITIYTEAAVKDLTNKFEEKEKKK